MRQAMWIINYGMFIISFILSVLFLCDFLSNAYDGIPVAREFQNWMYTWIIGTIYTGCNSYVLWWRK